jgi:sulfatase maturation enzyme AslB (radical SAM superfamily)
VRGWRATVEVHFSDPLTVSEAFLDRVGALAQDLPDTKNLTLVLSGPFEVPDEAVMEALFRGNVQVRVVHGWWPGCAEEDYGRIRDEALRSLGQYGIIAPAYWYVHTYNISLMNNLLEHSLQANCYSGVAAPLHILHPGWAPSESCPPIPDMNQYINLIISIFTSYSHYDAVFAPLNEVAVQCSSGNWSESNGVPCDLQLVFRGDGAVRHYRQIPFLARRLCSCNDLLSQSDNDILIKIMSEVRDGFDWGNDAYCGRCEWKNLCGGVDSDSSSGDGSSVQAMQDIVCGYRKLFFEVFMLYRLRMGGLATVSL